MIKSYLVFIFFVLLSINLSASASYSNSGDLLTYQSGETKTFQVDIENGVSLCVNVEGEMQEVLSEQCSLDFGGCLTLNDGINTHYNKRKSYGRDLSALIAVYKESDGDTLELNVTNHYEKEKSIRLTPFQDLYKLDVIQSFSPGEMKEYTISSDQAMQVVVKVIKPHEPVKVSCNISSEGKENCISLGQLPEDSKSPNKWTYSSTNVGIGYTAKEPDKDGLIKFSVISHYQIKKNLSIKVLKPKPSNWCEVAKWASDELRDRERQSSTMKWKESTPSDVVKLVGFIIVVLCLVVYWIPSLRASLINSVAVKYFCGRWPRKTFNLAFLGGLIVFYGLIDLSPFLNKSIALFGIEALGVVVALVTILMNTGFVLISILRLHDINRRGWWALLGFIPYVNILFVILLMLWPSSSKRLEQKESKM